MEIEETFFVRAPVRKVWEFLVDSPEGLVSCIPGCEKIERINEKTYLSVVSVRVGPVSVRFEFQTTLMEMDAPWRFKAIGKGMAKGLAGKMGEFHQESFVELKEISENRSEVHYKATISVMGKLATFGNKIMMAKAREMGEKFVFSLKGNLEKEMALIS